MGVTMTALLVGISVGMALGYFFFQGLFWTVQMVIRARQPWLVGSASFLIRAAIAMSTFYFLGRQGQMPAVIGCLVGFAAMKTFLVGTRRKPRYTSSVIKVC